MVPWGHSWKIRRVPFHNLFPTPSPGTTASSSSSHLFPVSSASCKFLGRFKCSVRPWHPSWPKLKLKSKYFHLLQWLLQPTTNTILPQLKWQQYQNPVRQCCLRFISTDFSYSHVDIDSLTLAPHNTLIRCQISSVSLCYRNKDLISTSSVMIGTWLHEEKKSFQFPFPSGTSKTC